MPKSGHLFRYCVELRDIRDGSTRALPLHTVIKVDLTTARGEKQRPREEFLQLEDRASTLEAATLDELAAKLRSEYPDEFYERTLHKEPDLAAEHAMGELIKLVARAAMEKLIRERDPTA